MRDEQVLFGVMIPVLAMGTALLMARSQRRHKEKLKRLEVLQEALQHPALDERTRAELSRVMVEEHRRASVSVLERFGWLRRVGYSTVMAVSWLMFVVGGATWIIGSVWGWQYSRYSSYMLNSAITATIIGFACLTVPIALRELSGRRSATAR